MIPERLLPLEVTWQEPNGDEDRYGNTVDIYTEPDDGWPTIRAWIEQQDTAELRDGRDTLVSHWLLVTNETGVTGKARIGWDARLFEIDGEPRPVHTPAGLHHLEARLLEVTG